MRLRTLARRLMSRLWFRPTRRAVRLASLWLVLTAASVSAVSVRAHEDEADAKHPVTWTEEILSAEFVSPTSKYSHGVLGDAVEWSGLRFLFPGNHGAREAHILLPRDHVFEDLKPRLVDLTLDGRPNAMMVVETDMALGAALALYGAHGKIAETLHIGRANRWLAPVAAGDLDGDGRVELAYVDRPHLAKTLRIWRFDAGTLTEVASMSGVTNHRIGDDFITSGLRRCAEISELILVDASWKRLIAVRLAGEEIASRDIGPFAGQVSLQAALACE